MYMTPWVKRLLAANFVVFLLTASQPAIAGMLAYVPALVLVRPWTIVTYMFVHASFTHILFNMIGLFFFGPRIEHRLGSKRFLVLYFLCGLGGAVFFSFFQPRTPVVGASGAVYGVLFAFAYFWPREPIYIWGILPIEARWLAAGIIGISLYSGITGSGRTAHFAHLGGIALAFGYLKWSEWRHERRKRRRRTELPNSAHDSRKVKDRHALSRWKGIPVDALHELNREEVRQLLAKAESSGVKSLSPDERVFLDRIAESSRR